MGDTTIKKVSGGQSPQGPDGQRYLASGKHVAMRLWVDEPPTDDKPSAARDYETVGYVVSGKAELVVEETRIGRQRVPATWLWRAIEVDPREQLRWRLPRVIERIELEPDRLLIHTRRRGR